MWLLPNKFSNIEWVGLSGSKFWSKLINAQIVDTKVGIKCFKNTWLRANKMLSVIFSCALYSQLQLILLQQRREYKTSLFSQLRRIKFLQFYSFMNPLG